VLPEVERVLKMCTQVQVQVVAIILQVKVLVLKNSKKTLSKTTQVITF